MPSQIILGFDFGMKRIGVAVGNTITQTAKPLKTLSAKQGVPDWGVIQQLISEWQAGACIVGIPTMIDGREQFTTQAAREFAMQLQQHTNLSVYTVDERLTTVEAREQVFREGGYKSLQATEIDTMAAKLIVEQWLGEQKNG